MDGVGEFVGRTTRVRSLLEASVNGVDRELVLLDDEILLFLLSCKCSSPSSNWLLSLFLRHPAHRQQQIISVFFVIIVSAQQTGSQRPGVHRGRAGGGLLKPRAAQPVHHEAAQPRCVLRPTLWCAGRESRKGLAQGAPATR